MELSTKQTRKSFVFAAATAQALDVTKEPNIEMKVKLIYKWNATAISWPYETEILELNTNYYHFAGIVFNPLK